MTTPAELCTLRQQAYHLAGLVQFAHEAQQAGLDPPDTDPVEYALRMARYRSLAAAQATARSHPPGRVGPGPPRDRWASCSRN
jgi:hypothetical protein